MTAGSAFEKHLLDGKVLSEDRLARSKAEADKRGVPLVEVVEQLGFASADALYRSLAEFCELPFVSLTASAVAPELAAKVPARFATHYRFVPTEEKDGTLVVAVSDPLNTHLIDDIRQIVHQRVEAVVATPEEIRNTTKTLYGLGADTVERILGDSKATDPTVDLRDSAMTTELVDETMDASIIKFVNELFSEAVEAGATDIHIEPYEDELRVRYRIDGVLHQVPTPASIRGLHSAIVSRVKVMANLNIAEKRLPQDGKIRASVDQDEYDLRVSVLPTPHGETINIRILSRASMFENLSELGFLPDELEVLNGFIARPNGIVLLTGPTGSGKTTTLYASLNKLNKLDHKIITIEDPIEYQLKGITQMQVQRNIGLDFSAGLRSMLRHDPDIMMVGEIRDYETAEMAIRSSLTGHLVFSTLHTNEAAGTVTRLIDMGVEPFLIASTMIGAIAQRLVRRVCDACGAPVQHTEETLTQLGLADHDPASASFRVGTGCEACRHTGYRGRLAICEILPFSTPIRELTVARAASSAIKQKASELGMRTLRESGWLRAKAGITTLDEVLRVTAAADMA